MLIMVMHYLCCIWIQIGNSVNDSWLIQHGFENKDEF
jgi:hypothetical protein